MTEPTPQFTQADIDAAIQQSVQAALAQQAQQHAEELAAVRQTLAPVLTTVPENGGGPGTQIAETWSLAEQTEANANR
jgi:hypothetical protein